MSPESFVYWLQGALELGELKTFDEHQVQVLKDHIALVLNKQTPDRQRTPSPKDLFSLELQKPTPAIPPNAPIVLPVKPYLGNPDWVQAATC